MVNKLKEWKNEDGKKENGKKIFKKRWVTEMVNKKIGG